MNLAEPAEPEQPPTQSTNRPSRLLSDWRVAVVILTALWLVIYMVGLSTPALLDDADTVHAEAAREMLQRHDWVTLYANGVRYLEKAPLMYWSVATSYKVFGISEWSTRFPLMLGVLGMILATYGLGRWAFGAEGGFDSGLVMATALGPYLFTRFLIPDVQRDLHESALGIAPSGFLVRRGTHLHRLLPGEGKHRGIRHSRSLAAGAGCP